MRNDVRTPTTVTVAAAVAEFIQAQGIERVFSLPGGHMKPIWDELHSRGVRIVTARHEVAAVHMAQAEADLHGRLSVAIVTTGPGLTNAVTGLGCAFLAGSPVLLISTRPPTQQAGMGALEEVDQASIVRPVCRSVEVVQSARHVIDRLDRAVASALGEDGPSGPVFVEFPTDILKEPVGRRYTGYPPRSTAQRLPADSVIKEAAELIATSTRPLVIGGRDALGAPDELRAIVEQIGAVYLDTRISKGALSTSITSYVPAARSRAMAQADLVITVGRQLDFEVGYGSPAVFRRAERMVRIGRNSTEVQSNRRGDVEVRSDVGPAMAALIATGCKPALLDRTWLDSMMFDNTCRVERLHGVMAESPDGDDGGMHPYRVISALNQHIDEDTIVIADGGDILSWARSGLSTPTYLDLGAFGCLGVGVPFAVSASLNHPGRRVVALVGDGAFGFNAMELETAAREGAKCVIVVANNSAFNIERADQIVNYDGRVVGTDLSSSAFDQLAESLGVTGYRVDKSEDLDDTLTKAFANAPALVDVRVTGEPLSSDTNGGLAAVPDLHALVAWDEAENIWTHQLSTTGSVTMNKTTVHQPSTRESPRGYVEAISTPGSVVAISGQLPSEEVLASGSDFATHFLSALERFAEVVTSSGASVTDVLVLRIYVTDMAAYRASAGDVGREYRRILGGQFPATTLVEVSAFVDDRALVEIEGLATFG